MAICYDDSVRQPFSGININMMNPIPPYLKHYDNLMYLTFLANKSDDRNERHQAAKELMICNRKLKFWSRHPDWNAKEAGPKIEEIKKRWEQ